MRLLLLLACLSWVGQANAQRTFSMQEAITYGIQSHANIRNAQADMADAELQIKEIKVTGLPKINGQFQYTSNIIVPTQLLDAKNFNPQAADGEVVKFRFGVPWGGQAGIGINQLVFDATWLVGLRAADTYRQLAAQGLRKAKEDVAEQVSKAYLSVLVAEERAKILQLNVNRLDSALYTTKAFLNQGFVEKLDVTRLEVQRNNLVTEQRRIAGLIELSYQLLRFQMGYSGDEPFKLTDRLNDAAIQTLLSTPQESVNPSERVEYQQLMTQRRLTELNIERYQKAYLPSVFLTGSLGAGHSNIRLNPFERWFGSSAVSLGVNIPIYDSGMKRVQIDRQRLNLAKIDQSAKFLAQSFDLQNESAYTNLRNGLENLEIQKRNMELATEVVRVSQLKYQQGVGSNLEVTNAESDLKQSQTNYFAALYDVLIAKVDLQRAQGKLPVE